MYRTLINEINALSIKNKQLLKSSYKKLFSDTPLFLSEIESLADALHYIVMENGDTKSHTNTNKQEQGRQVVAVFGLDRRESVHTLTINGVTRYTWCIWDAFFIAEVLKEPATINTIDPINKEHIEAIYSQDKQGQWSWLLASGCLVSFPKKTDNDTNSLRSAFCSYVHLFTCDKTAQISSQENNCDIFSADVVIERGIEMADAICHD